MDLDMIKQILIVEDEPKVASILGKYLINAGYHYTWIENGLSVLPWFDETPVKDWPDLVILDLMLPGCDGMEVYKQIQELAPIPVIMATARVEESERLKGLELGADDYVCKPYSPRELIVRVSNVLARSEKVWSKEQLIESAKEGLHIDINAMQARINGQSLDLTPAELRLLHFFQLHQDSVFTRQQLLDQAYEDFRVVTERSVDTHIKNLRKKLNNVGACNALIKSVYGVGYMFTMA
jgi:two-component system response regulator BaeR